MRNRLIKCTLTVILICCICFTALGCGNNVEPDWMDEWNSIIVDKTEEISAVSLSYCSFTSSSVYLPCYYTDKEDIDSIVGMLDELEFEEVPYEELNKPLADGGGIKVTVISDEDETLKEGGGKSYNETGSTYKKAVTCYVQYGDYVYVMYNPPAPDLGSAEECRYYKSTTKVSYDDFFNLHEASQR